MDPSNNAVILEDPGGFFFLEKLQGLVGTEKNLEHTVYVDQNFKT